MKNTLETRLGVFVALIVIGGWLIVDTLGGFDALKSGYHVQALFNSAQELKLGDRVKMAGVEVGKVESIALETNKVRVVMKLRKDVMVRTDSTATIKFTGLVGQNFVAISFGSSDAPRADEGSLIASAEQPDLSTIMAKLDNVATGVENLTKSFTGDKIDNLLGPFTDFLKQNSGPLTATIANIKAVSDEVAEGKGTVGKLINDPALYNSLLVTVTNLEVTLADVRSVMGDVKTGEGSVGKLINDPTLYNEATASMTNLKEILQKINNGQGSVGRLVNDQEFYKNAKLSLQKLDKATEGLEDSGPLSVIGTIAGNLF